MQKTCDKYHALNYHRVPSTINMVTLTKKETLRFDHYLPSLNAITHANKRQQSVLVAIVWNSRMKQTSHKLTVRPTDNSRKQPAYNESDT